MLPYVTSDKAAQIAKTVVTELINKIQPGESLPSFSGKIEVSDWELHSGNKYWYIIKKIDHNLINPHIGSLLVQTENGYSLPFYNYTVLPNGDILIKSDIQVTCKYKLYGDR